MSYDSSLVLTILIVLSSLFMVLFIAWLVTERLWGSITNAHGGSDVGAPLSRGEWGLWPMSTRKTRKMTHAFRRSFAQKYPDVISEQTVERLHRLEWMHQFAERGMAGLGICFFTTMLIAAALKESDDRASGRNYLPAGLPGRFEVIENLDNGDTYVRDPARENICFLVSPGIWSHDMTYVPCEDLKK